MTQPHSHLAATTREASLHADLAPSGHSEAARRMLGDDHPTDPHEFWEAFYSRPDKPWTGRPNFALVTELTERPIPATTALDLGCGSGADAIWLAEQGWQVTGVDISSAALATAREAASRSADSSRPHWIQADLDVNFPAGRWGLVVASYLHSPVEFGRLSVLGQAAEAVAPGGDLLIIGHLGPPSWAQELAEHLASMPQAEQVRDELDLVGWTTESLDNVEVPMVSPEGEQGSRLDNVLRIRRPH